jgi:hypothetical protein
VARSEHATNFFCSDFSDAEPCCLSCHEDSEAEGFWGEIEVYADDMDLDSACAFLCCAVARVVTEGRVGMMAKEKT